MTTMQLNPTVVVSVIVTLKNGIEFLPDAIHSVWEQTFCDCEILIGVNGSKTSPCVVELADLFVVAHQHPYTRVFDLRSVCENKPQTANKLISMSRGEFIAVIDVDDIWHPTKLAKQLDAIRTLNVDLVGTRGEYFGDVTGAIPTEPGIITFDMLLECNHFLHSSVLMKREIAYYEDTDLLDDYPTWLRFAHEGRTLYNLEEALTFIRVHPGQHFPSRDNSADIRAKWKAIYAKQ